MKIQTSELTGASLDWAVCLALGRTDYFDYSTDWSLSGPIIELEKLAVRYDDIWAYDPADPEDNGERWYAERAGNAYGMYGPTLLIAALRCYVASKLGNEVEIPKEILS
jgi:hypothetical protein